VSKECRPGKEVMGEELVKELQELRKVERLLSVEKS
jgi:hypothetical protein